MEIFIINIKLNLIKWSKEYLNIDTGIQNKKK